MILISAKAAAPGFLPATMNLVDSRPGATLRFFFRNAAALVAFLDVLCLSFLFVSVFGFVPAWHHFLLLDSTKTVQTLYRRAA